MAKLTKVQIKKIQLLKQEVDFKLRDLSKKQGKVLADYHKKIDLVKQSFVKDHIKKIRG